MVYTCCHYIPMPYKCIKVFQCVFANTTDQHTRLLFQNTHILSESLWCCPLDGQLCTLLLHIYVGLGQAKIGNLKCKKIHCKWHGQFGCQGISRLPWQRCLPKWAHFWLQDLCKRNKQYHVWSNVCIGGGGGGYLWTKFWDSRYTIPLTTSLEVIKEYQMHVCTVIKSNFSNVYIIICVHCHMWGQGILHCHMWGQVSYIVICEDTLKSP